MRIEGRLAAGAEPTNRTDQKSPIIRIVRRFDSCKAASKDV